MLSRTVSIIRVLLPLLIIAFQWHYTSQHTFMSKNLKPKVPDVGTRAHFIALPVGEATLIQIENGSTILIDTGSLTSQPQLYRYLKQHQVRRIDGLFVTNEEEEHIGNVQDILADFAVRTVYYPYQLEDEAFASVLRQYPHITFRALKRGDVIEFHDENVINVLHPDHQLSLSPQDNSLVLQWQHGKNRFLFTSDISRQTEQELAHTFDLESQILKVSDYGSIHASSAEFIQDVDAHVGIVFYRPERYLDPRVVQKLEESWMDVYAIKEYGHIVVVSVKDDYKVYLLGMDEQDQ